jgi:hypothetical protein
MVLEHALGRPSEKTEAGPDSFSAEGLSPAELSPPSSRPARDPGRSGGADPGCGRLFPDPSQTAED